MLVRDLMRPAPQSCAPGTSLAAVIKQLLACGSGALPVTDANGKMVGMITGRDISVALGSKDCRPSDLVAGQVMSRNIATCGGMDDIHAALKTMRTRQVRRLPVLDEQSNLEGVLCISDLILEAQHDSGSKPPLSYEDVMSTLRGIFRHRLPATASIR